MSRAAGSVVHVCQPGALVGIEAARLVVRWRDTELVRHPLNWTSMLCLHHRSITVSGPALAALAAADAPVAWFAGNGRFIARCVPPWSADAGRRWHQYQRCADQPASLDWARHLIGRKVQAQAAALKRRLHNSGRSAKGLAALRDAALRRVERATDFDVLRGAEGIASRTYFRSLARTLPDDLRFDRRCRPADGLVNAGLNLLYTQLTWRMDAAVQAAGFDPGQAPLHRLNPSSKAAWGRPSLACDLIEPLRPILVDAFWFPLLGQRRLGTNDVFHDAELGTRFSDEARGQLLGWWEDHWKQEEGWLCLDHILAAWRRWTEGYDPASAWEAPHANQPAPQAEDFPLPDLPL